MFLLSHCFAACFRSGVLIMMPRLTSNACAQIISQPTKQPGTCGLVFLKIEHTHYTTKNTLLPYISTYIAHNLAENGRWKQWTCFGPTESVESAKLSNWRLRKKKKTWPMGRMHGHNTCRWAHSIKGNRRSCILAIRGKSKSRSTKTKPSQETKSFYSKSILTKKKIYP